MSAGCYSFRLTQCLDEASIDLLLLNVGIDPLSILGKVSEKEQALREAVVAAAARAGHSVFDRRKSLGKVFLKKQVDAKLKNGVAQDLLIGGDRCTKQSKSNATKLLRYAVILSYMRELLTNQMMLGFVGVHNAGWKGSHQIR